MKYDFEDPRNAKMRALLEAAASSPKHSGYGVDLSDMSVTMVREATLDKITVLEARIEELEIEAAMWRALAGPIWMGDESDGHFLCLACNQRGTDGGGTRTIPHLVDCEYADALAAKEET